MVDLTKVAKIYSMKFANRENLIIKGLVELSWETLANHRGDILLYQERNMKPDELIDESDKLADRYSSEDNIALSGSVKATRMGRPKRKDPPPIIAVDAGVVNLGSLAKGGIVFAVRGTACCYTSEGSIIVLRYNTGAIAIDNTNKLEVLHQMGGYLGEPEFYVKVIEEEPFLAETSSFTETADQTQDRFRNFVERIIQAEAVGILKKYGGGILLIDGAITPRAFDTPDSYVKNLLDQCNKNLIDVVAISKKTTITVAGIPIQKFLTEAYGPDFIGYVPIKKLLQDERRKAQKAGGKNRIRVTKASEMYAAKFGFSPTSMTFRVDLHNCRGMTTDEVINDVYNYCRIYGGYPKPLIEAHQNSCFLFQDFQNLLAQATVKLGSKPQFQPSMDILFQPFGASGK